MLATELPQLDVREILARLERHRATVEGQAILAFDADGTLWTGDVGVELFGALVEAGGVREEARPALEVEARAAGVTVEGSANDVGRALLTAFHAGLYDECRGLAMMAWAFAGWRRAEVVRFAGAVLEAGRIDARLRHALAPVVRWAEERDIETWVVSASPDAVLKLAVPRLGLHPERVLAMRAAIEDDVIAARLDGPAVYGPGKLEAIQRTRPQATLLGVFGDSGYDAAMLGAARVAVAVDPKPSLLEAATSLPELVLLASLDPESIKDRPSAAGSHAAPSHRERG
jgi:phosphatidylglycerophosphatase C